ncbi:DoxX family protein [Flavobacteriaceae bacterium]|nr:DoxX family protein [Flavobacteriaceae bacterium]MDC1493042.1 DoxX family protein [Flavobacteriaceae bacterium]
MNITFIISLFSGISFIVYGITSFRSKRMISEFERWGYANQRKLIGCFQLIGGVGLMVGTLFEIPINDTLINNVNIIAASSCLLTVLMVGAIFVRINIKDKFVNTLPATLYAILNFVIFYNVFFD